MSSTRLLPYNTYYCDRSKMKLCTGTPITAYHTNIILSCAALLLLEIDYKQGHLWLVVGNPSVTDDVSAFVAGLWRRWCGGEDPSLQWYYYWLRVVGWDDPPTAAERALCWWWSAAEPRDHRSSSATADPATSVYLDQCFSSINLIIYYIYTVRDAPVGLYIKYNSHYSI